MQTKKFMSVIKQSIIDLVRQIQGESRYATKTYTVLLKRIIEWRSSFTILDLCNDFMSKFWFSFHGRL